MEDPTQVLTNHGRVVMSKIARFINAASHGKVKPAHITTLSLLGHFPAAWALWTCRPVLAAAFVIIFGLMDALDGALARLQNTASKLGMFYDATSDRLKEIILYAALAVYVDQHIPEAGAWLVVAVAGSSLLVSYVKAKGEMAVSDKNHDKQRLNRAFGGGIARYEIRMALLVVALLTGFVAPIMRLMLALNMLTAAIRFLEISAMLHAEDTKARKQSRKTTK